MKFSIDSLIVQRSDDVLLTEITRLAQRLSLDPDIEVEHIGHFLRDMDWIKVLSSKAYGLRFLNVFDASRNYEESEAKVVHAISELKSVFRSSRNRHIGRLTSSKKFRVTPLLVYLDDKGPLSIDAIVSRYPVVDVCSTLQEHRHLFEIHTLNQ